jgi:signal transduction histidine kinase
VEAWFDERLPRVEVKERFLTARQKSPEFKSLSDAIVNATPLSRVLLPNDVPVADMGVSEWVARVVCRYMNVLIDGMDRASVQRLAIWEDAAVEQFALGRLPTFESLYFEEWTLPVDAAESWVNSSCEPTLFSNQLILHYFLARKIAAEIREGRTEILTRYKFPREYVLLFLAVLSPEAASIATAERGEEIREQIEAEVERRLQLTLAHALKRSAGAVRSHVNTIRRIDEEIDFQRALAEQTRRWHEVPEASIEAVPVGEIALSSVERIAANHPGVTHRIDIDPGLRIRASRDLLREILDCLVENAFEAVVFAEGIATPRVAVRARAEGNTVRIDVIDNGPGVAPRDRDLIFDLYVTTKKGGDNKPLGTGMGLPIARRYAEHVGGQVGLDPEHEGTCFFARFVAWKELS